MSTTIQETIQKCENIGCGVPLGHYDIKKKSRFCRKCKGTSHPLEWKCLSCGGTISNSECRETRKFCKTCSGMATKCEFMEI